MRASLGESAAHRTRGGQKAQTTMSTVTVSLDNGHSTTAITTADAAAAFVARYGERNIVDHLAAQGLPTEDYADALAVLAAFAGSLPAGEVPTLP